MKVGIISQFNRTNVNYGNKLQAYALNRYLTGKMPNDSIISLFFLDYGKNIITQNESCFELFTCKVRRIPQKITGVGKQSKLVINRLKRINKFSEKNINIPDKPWTWDDLENSNFDIVIVGSDIVWGQSRGRVNRKFFLDFEGKKKFVKVSYAASFGRDWIPKENIDTIKMYLDSFSNISVRESSSVKLLSEIGINDVKYCVDPTLLISGDEWRLIENKPDGESGKYIFVYLLGRGKEERKFALNLAKLLKLNIVTIPFATGEKNHVDEIFGDIRLLDCSVEEWIWLIDHAEYIVTDSFHGSVFSTIFRKKFIILARKYEENINNRIIDFLNNIGQSNKLFSSFNNINLFDLEWNYDEIYSKLDPLINYSKEFLQNAVIDRKDKKM